MRSMIPEDLSEIRKACDPAFLAFLEEHRLFAASPHQVGECLALIWKPHESWGHLQVDESQWKGIWRINDEWCRC